MPVDLGSFLVEFAVAAAIGGLIGVEREHRARAPESGKPEETVIAGVRTFPLVSIAGFVVAFLAKESGSPFVMAAGVVGAFATALTFSYLRSRLGLSGMTSPLAMIVTFLLGSMVGYGFTFEAVVIGVVATFLLVTKTRLHQFAEVLDEEEILSALQFITVLFILLPLTAALQPPVLGASWIGRSTAEHRTIVDPFVILLTVVFVSSISFVSLLVMRQLGPSRGMEFSGLIGGLVNSEATTASLAERARDRAELMGPALVGVFLATVTMMVRNLAIAAFADQGLSLFFRVLPYAIPLVLVGLVFAWRERRRHAHAPAVAAVRVKNPFAILPAVRFALIFAAVSIGVAVAQESLGDAGVYIAAVGGLVSAGPVVASLGSLVATGSVPVHVAVRAALLAIALSFVNKLIILRWVDRATFDRARGPLAAMTGLALAATAVSFAL